MKIEIWSDIACPWCAVGRGNLMKALAAYEKKDVDVLWRSFELNPAAPPKNEGDYVLLLAQKYGKTREDAQGWIDQMSERAAEVDVAFDFSKIQSGNTFDAHRLIHFAHQHGKQDAMKVRLLEAYFQEGILMSSVADLVRLAVEVGLDEAECKRVLESTEFADDVRKDEATASELGISGVPFFVVDGKYALSGAQPAEAFLSVFAEVEKGRAQDEATKGEHCDVDGC